MASELKSEGKVNQIIEAFKAALARAIQDGKVSQLNVEVNFSPQGGVSRCYMRTMAEVR